jgi:hypothetical protein
MFVRRKKSGAYEYLQIVHNERIDGRVKQRVTCSAGWTWCSSTPRRSTSKGKGARRSVKEVYDQVLRRGGRYHEVYGPKKGSKDPAPLKVKEVWVEDRRYIVCHNEDQAKKDRDCWPGVRAAGLRGGQAGVA